MKSRTPSMPGTIEYTGEQRKAIEARQVSLSLDAGAGCGKTFVLTERFLAELESSSGTRPDARLSQLVAITFTDAAARELRTRIRGMVADRINNATEGDRDYWLQLGRAIDACRISTIHSLCGNLLREHAFAVGLDPLFTTLDGASAAVLETDAIDDTLRDLLFDRNPDAMAITGAWGIESAKQAIAGLMQHYRKPAFSDWIRRDPNEALAAWRSYYEQTVWPAAQQELLPVARDLLELVPQVSPKTAEEQEAKSILLAGLDALVAGKATPPQLVAARKHAVANRKPFSKSYWESPTHHSEFKQSASKFRELVDRLPDADLSSQSAIEAAELGIAAARVAGAAAEQYQQAKSQRAALDFDDLLATTHQLLTNPAHRNVQQSLRSGIGVLFVDEFQDTDRVQVEMVKALVGDIVESGKLFFVGDDKQSIYRFRGAEPQVFIDLRSEIDTEWQLPLSKNFRSQPAILNFVNTLFDDVFDNYQRLSPSRPQATPEPAIELLWTDVPKTEANKTGYAKTARKSEARAIAKRLRTLIDDGTPAVADKSHADGCRSATYGDIAILFRVLSDIALYEEALRAEQIPYYLVGGHAFYTQQEIYDILHLLRVVASECDELSLAGVLRSPFFALADETLFWLASNHRSLERGLFAKAIPSELDSDERHKVAAAADTIKYLRERKDRLGVPQLIASAMERTGYDAALLADFMGERKLANVYKLIEQARAAVASDVGSLDDFVTQLATFTTSTPKEALATTSPGTANVVRLMTVHKSKGLEFPIVVVPDLDRKTSPNRDQVAFDPDLGPLVAPARDTDRGSSGLKLYKHVDNQAETAESDRLFYVACTRAADYLLLSSAVSDINKLEGPWIKRLAETVNLADGTLCESLTSNVLPQPKIKAVLSPPPKAASHATGRATNWLKVLEQAKRQKNDPAIDRSAGALDVAPAARQRFSVTRLSGQIIPAGGDWWQGDSEAISDRPAGSKGEVDPLGFGTLVHAVLERANLADPGSIAPWCETLAPQHDLLHAATAQRMATELIERFYASARAAELRNATEVHHELEFMLTWPVGSTIDTTRYLQGYLDCLYMGADGSWRIVDYKTNQVSAAGVPALAAKYELQMLVYGLAIEQTWGTGPAELVLHFLRPGIEHVIEWNTKTRKRAILLVDKALSSLTANQ